MVHSIGERRTIITAYIRYILKSDARWFKSIIHYDKDLVKNYIILIYSTYLLLVILHDNSEGYFIILCVDNTINSLFPPQKEGLEDDTYSWANFNIIVVFLVT